MLRYHTIALQPCRVAIADVTIGGAEIKAGEGVYALLAAANRDPSAFREPDKFDIERKNAVDHLTFSYGLHQCIGQPLARLELNTAFATVPAIAFAPTRVPLKRSASRRTCTSTACTSFRSRGSECPMTALETGVEASR
jgi:cytochrome P450